MKKELKIVAVVLAAIIVFLTGFGLGTSKGIQIDIKVDGAAQTGGVVTQTPATSSAPQTTVAQQTTTAAPTPDSGDTTAPSQSDNQGTPSAIPSSTAEIAAKYNEVVNALKKCDSVTVHKTGVVNIECTDCSVSMLKGLVNTILQNFISNSEDTITFTGQKGNNSKGEEKWINDYIAPGSKEATVSEGDLASATAVAEGDGYKMTLVFKAEKSTYDGTNTVYPEAHMTAMTPLNLATLELPMGAVISQAEMSYPGATAEATVDGSGRLTRLYINLPLEGSGTGELKGMSLSVGLKGNMDDTFEMTY